VLEKDNNERMIGLQRVHTMLHGMNTTDVGVEVAKATVFHSTQNSFDNKAVEFMSAYISNRHAGAQTDYANRHSSGGGSRGRRYVSAPGSDDTRGGRGRTGSGHSGQRGGRGRGNPRRTYANNVDITDPHRNFTSAEWEKLGTMRNYVCNCKKVAAVVVAEETRITVRPPTVRRIAQLAASRLAATTTKPALPQQMIIPLCLT
jgi:hypothetical protein